MATRLYPATENTAVIERLAGVPAGTAERWAALEDARQKAKKALHATVPPGGPVSMDVHAKSHMIDEAFYEEVFNDSAISKYNHFTLFGWGRFHCPRLVNEQKGNLYSGRTTDRDEVLTLTDGIDLNGVAVDDLNGLYWS